jgi:hypothetical protein
MDQSFTQNDNSILDEINLLTEKNNNRSSFLTKSVITNDILDSGEVRDLKKKLTKLMAENDKLKKTVENYKTQNELIRSSYDVLQQSFCQDNLESTEPENNKELKMLNEMLTMEINTYKIKIDSLQSEVSKVKNNGPSQ